MKTIYKITILYLILFGFLFTGCFENMMMFHPSHEDSNSLAKNNNYQKWIADNKFIGWKHIRNPHNRTWLFIHGNAGQAMHRIYAENCFNNDENIYILEYPGFGDREGSPSMQSFNDAAIEAYKYLKEEVEENRICIIGESIGSGPASFLASQNINPEKIVLVVPFDNMIDLAHEKVPFLPVSWIMKNKWDNIESIKSFNKTIEIYGAENDNIIPIHHAQNLSKSNKNCIFYKLPCGHNEWTSFVKLY